MPALQHPHEVLPRKDGSPWDGRLKAWDGFQCNICRFLTVSPQTMSRHAKGLHERTRLEMGLATTAAMCTPVYLQAWTRNPVDGQYWVVSRDGIDARPVVRPGLDDHLRGVLERERGRWIGTPGHARQSTNKPDAPASAVAGGPTSLAELRPWLERTGWESTYGRFNRDVLRALTTMPSAVSVQKGLLIGRDGCGRGAARLTQDVFIASADEQKLAALAAAVECIMERCEHTARTTSRNILCWLRSIRPHAPYGKP